MFIAGTAGSKIVIAEPEALRIALYIRDVVGLEPITDPMIPPLDPPADVWPVWSRRPAEVSAPGAVRLLRGRELDLTVASAQWARWWRHALDVGSGAMDDLKPPDFPALAAVPDLRVLMQQHFANASLWSDGLSDDPRFKRAHSAPGQGLNTLIRDLPNILGRPPRRFTLRISVIGVQSKHAWTVAPDHLLLTRHLIADLDNALDWLRPRILALA